MFRQKLYFMLVLDRQIQFTPRYNICCNNVVLKNHHYYSPSLRIQFNKTSLLPLFPVAPTLEHRTSVKSFVSFQFLNPRTVGRTPWTRDQPVARQTDVHALSGIRTPSSSVRAGEDSSCLRPRGHCDRLASERAKTVHALDRAATVTG
jgi:hypothetical protein